MQNLVIQWRNEAALYRKRGATSLAEMVESFAADLEAAIQLQELEALTIREGVAVSGYSYSALQKLLASGELENVGSKGSPRIRRGDLPRKPGRIQNDDFAERVLLSRLK